MGPHKTNPYMILSLSLNEGARIDSTLSFPPAFLIILGNVKSSNTVCELGHLHLVSLKYLKAVSLVNKWLIV